MTCISRGVLNDDLSIIRAFYNNNNNNNNIIIIIFFFFCARKHEACRLKIDVGLWSFVSEVTHV